MIFLIGNGPSLNQTNLDLLVGQESWGTASIDLLYPKTSWRPTRYWFNDHPQADVHLNTILFHVTQGYPCWYRSDVRQLLTGEYRAKDCYPWLERAYAAKRLPLSEEQLAHVTGWNYCNEHNAGMIRSPRDGKPNGRHATAWHLDGSGTLCKYGSGLNCMLQQAFLEGHNPIVLLGCDLGYRARKQGEPDLDHFAPDYNIRPFPDEFYARVEEETHIDFHTQARDYCKAHGVEILNATVGGNLEVYPRVKLEEIL